MGQVDKQSVQFLSTTNFLLIPGARIMCFPRWRGLRHFADGAMAITFSDGSTFEDLSKVFLGVALEVKVAKHYTQISMFVLHNIFKEGTPGYLLLKALRCYIEVDLYASLEVHTEATIASGRKKLTRFYKLIEASPLSIIFYIS